MKRIITISIILLLVGIVSYRLFSNKKHIDEKKKPAETASVKVAVNVARAQIKTSEKKLSLVGTVAANQQLELKAEAAGRIVGLHFKLGDFVTKGRILARIDNTVRELSQATAAQTLADAKQNLERYKNLFEGGAATKAQYDQMKLAYENAKNQFEQAKKQVSDAAIVAPISGYITQKTVEPGAFVNIGTPIGTIVDVSSLKVQLSIPEREAYSLKTNDPVTITTNVYPGIKFQGRISFVSMSGDAAHNYPVEITLKNNNKNPLKAGTYVDVTFEQTSSARTLQIPREALVGSLKEARVYVVDSTKRVAKIRPVTLGADYGDFLEVLNGLKEGDLVVTNGQINLTDSTQISIIK